MGCKNCGKKAQRHSTSSSVPRIEDVATTTEVKPWSSLPLYNEAVLPDDIDVIGGSSKEYQAWRIPLSMIIPGGTLNPSTYTIPVNTSVVEIPSRQVVPVFLGNSLQPAEAAKAIEGMTAQALAIARDEKGIVLQSNGFLKFNRPHPYEVGKTYYLSQDVAGEVISARPSAGIVQPLFTVIDQLTISINIALL